MSHYRFYRSVPVDVYGKGEYLGPEWVLGLWEYEVDRPQWGLMHFNEPTQMSYGLDYAKPKEIIKQLEDQNENVDTDWYFDVGRKVTVKKEALVQAFKDLGIWNE